MEMPLFPLHVVLFPGARLPLHIFEQRYLDMIEKVLDGDRRFGVIAIRRGSDTGDERATTHAIGTIAEIEQIQRTAAGTMDILVAGSTRFALDVRLPDDGHPRGQVTFLDEVPGFDADLLLRDARTALHRYLGVVARLQRTDAVVPSIPTEPCEASHVLASAIQVDLPDRQRLLEAPDAASRLRLLIDLAHREALLLQRLGPPVTATTYHLSQN